MTSLPEHALPGASVQQGAVSGDGGEEGLGRALPHRGSLIHTQVREATAGRGGGGSSTHSS